MKKCDYCAKEITYFEQYCCDECQRKTIKFYDMREKYTKLFSFLNIICMFAIPAGLFISSLVFNAGLWMIGGACTVLGLTVIFIPLPVENMISSLKLKKAVLITRIIGLVILLIGISVIAYLLFFAK